MGSMKSIVALIGTLALLATLGLPGWARACPS
jgi:hypothetical protein